MEALTFVEPDDMTREAEVDFDEVVDELAEVLRVELIEVERVVEADVVKLVSDASQPMPGTPKSIMRLPWSTIVLSDYRSIPVFGGRQESRKGSNASGSHKG